MKIKKIFLTTLLLLSTNILSFEKVQFTFDDGLEKGEIIVNQPPQKAILLSQFMLESLLSLGLEEKIIGKGFLANPILPEYQKAYDNIPELPLNEGFALNKESFVASGADFISGWERMVSEETTGSLKELQARQVVPFISRGVLPSATLNTVYEDFLLLGKIFDVQENAENLVQKMKNEAAPIIEKTKHISHRPRVLVYDSIRHDNAFVAGSGIVSDLIYLAGGENIYKDLNEDWGGVSFEDVITQNPEIIVLPKYNNRETVEEKRHFLTTNPAFKDIDAIKNNRIYEIEFIEICPGVRNARAVGMLYQMFHGK